MPAVLDETGRKKAVTEGVDICVKKPDSSRALKKEALLAATWARPPSNSMLPPVAFTAAAEPP
ncbi:hypothetical protein D3C83_277550 [compost metagenome]